MVKKMQHKFTERQQGSHAGEVSEIPVVDIIFAAFHLML